MRPRTPRQLQAPERIAALSVSPQSTPRAIREWIRQHYVSQAITRLYEMGMGITTFDVPTAVGSVVNVPASPSVQRAALAEVVRYGLPQQLGLVDGDGNDARGVIALPALELDAVQRVVHGQRGAAESADESTTDEGEEFVEVERRVRALREART